MEFLNRIKKEMTEGIVKAILEDAGYRVIDSGIEKVIREISCLSASEYKNLTYPEAMQNLPDFTVMNREQTEKFLVEVKYRADWGIDLLEEVREQVKQFGEIVLVSVNAKASDPKNVNSPSRYIRCCALKYDAGQYKAELCNKDGIVAWESVHELKNTEKWLWWAMLPMHKKFTQMREDKNSSTLYSSIKALSGILEQ